MTRGTVCYAGLHPHPPIVVPEVAGPRLPSCQATHDACTRFAARLRATAPDRVVLVSPHAPRVPDAYGLYGGLRLRGDLGEFGASSVAVDIANDATFAGRLSAETVDRGLATWTIVGEPLDHGALVPLVFLVRAGFAGPVCVASLPWEPRPASLVAFGEAVRAAVRSLPGRAAVVASGDMTHRALPGAPAGFHRDAVRFDRTLLDLVATGRLDALGDLDPALRELAAEDVVDTSTIAAAAIAFEPRGAEILSYEHPFGVGYLVAVFHDGGAP